jgi:ribosomal-protein-alanine N-acetyltransferase
VAAVPGFSGGVVGEAALSSEVVICIVGLGNSILVVELHMSTHDMPYSILRLKEKDAPAVAALERACFSSAWTEEQYRALLRVTDAAQNNPDAEQPPVAVWGAFVPEKGLVAYVNLGVYCKAGELEVLNIAVSEPYRRLGLGGALLRRSLEWARGLGCEQAFLEVRVGNVAARALYQACGFTLQGLRKGYYADTGEDALILRCDLNQT